MQISRLQSEFSAYKIRAHALLQKKDAELNAAKNSDLIKEHEEAMRVCILSSRYLMQPEIWTDFIGLADPFNQEAEKEVAAALAERDQAIHDLKNAQSRHGEEIAARYGALSFTWFASWVLDVLWHEYP